MVEDQELLGELAIRYGSWSAADLVVRQPSIDRVSGEGFASLARRSDAGVAVPTSRRSNAASGVKDRQGPSNEG